MIVTGCYLWRCSVIGGRLFYGRSSGNGGVFDLLHMAVDSRDPRYWNVDSSVSA